MISKLQKHFRNERKGNCTVFLDVSASTLTFDNFIYYTNKTFTKHNS